MKKLPDTIENCGECPFIRDSEQAWNAYQCGHPLNSAGPGNIISQEQIHGGVVEDGPAKGNKIRPSIPDWCPLEDV